MSEAALHVVLAAFDGETGAEDALKSLKESRDEKLVGIQAAVALRKDEKGQIHFKDVGMTPAKGAVGGIVLGAVVGVLTGGTGLALGALGALVGGLVGKRKRDSRIPTEGVNQLAAFLESGSSAMLVIMEEGWVVVLKKELEALGGEVRAAQIPADIAEQSSADRDAAFATLTSELGIAPVGPTDND